MCEPAHSVVQFPMQPPDDFDNQLPFQDMDMKQRMEATLKNSFGKKCIDWGKRIRKWFHFSKLGTGHTGAMKMTMRQHSIFPLDRFSTKYENFWWDREFVLDGHSNVPIVDRNEAFISAKEYSNEVVLSNMKKFRRFFERSMKQTSTPFMYVERLLEGVLNKTGRDKVVKKLTKVFLPKSTCSFPTLHQLFGFNSHGTEQLDNAISVVLGFTRKRELFLPHWSDDDSLWK